MVGNWRPPLAGRTICPRWAQRTLAIPRSQPIWIKQQQWILQCISVGAHSCRQPNGITLNIPTRTRLIVSEVVVVQTRLGVKVLAGEAQVEGDCAGGCGFAEGVAEDGPIPDGGVVAGLDDFAGGAEVVGLDVVQQASPLRQTSCRLNFY